ncbi:MAG: molybdopterin cofactor-binding domain-containing protein [Thermoplasmata archaeon]
MDGPAKVTGQAQFADDIHLPGMLYAKLLRSPVPHGRIKSLDTSRAEALPGVVAVLTGQDLPEKYGILPVSQDEEALCTEKVRYVGDPIAAVAAVDEDTAEEATELIELDLEDLPSYMTIEEALEKEGEPIETLRFGPNVHKAVSLEFGDVATGFADADHSREDLFFFEGSNHLPMEQHAAVARWEPEGKVTLWSSTQTPHYVHRALAKVLGLPMNRIRVIATPVGGGFGGKSDPFNHEIVVAKLAMVTGKPVKLTLTREEVFYAHRGRHPTLMWVKTGVKEDGTITGMHFRSFLDGGAYGSYGVVSTYYTGALQTTTYKIPAYKFEGTRVYTNKPPCGPKRGHGTPQPRFAIEVHFEHLARELGMDPIDFRLKNLVEPFTYTANWLRITSCGLRECVDKVLDASQYREKVGKLPEGRGVGFGLSAYISGASLPVYWNDMPHSEVQLKVDRSGTVALFCGAIDIGQGSDQVLASTTAEVLGLEPEDIQLVTADTDLTPIDLGSYSSRVTFMAGNAAIQAAERLRAQIAEGVAAQLQVPTDRIAFRGGRVFDAQRPEEGVAWEEACALAETVHGSLSSSGAYKPPELSGPYKGAGVGPSPAYSYSACVAEVIADKESGVVEVEKVWIAHDIGRSLNPTLVLGQVEGSVYMGLGEVLLEEQTFRQGLHKIPSMLEYKSPTTKDMPPVETILVETVDPEGPFGAKECGQGPLLPVIPAVANAVHDAIGVRFHEIPITPDKVLSALDKAARGEEPLIGPTGLPDYGLDEVLHVEPPEGKKVEVFPMSGGD